MKKWTLFDVAVSLCPSYQFFVVSSLKAYSGYGKIHVVFLRGIIPLNEGEVENGREEIELAQEL